jgi:hypothetical protein
MATIKSKLTQIESKESNTASSFENIFNDFITTMIKEDELVDILTFVKSPYYLNIKTLQPPQQFILKVFYGLQLDDQDKCIRLKSFPQTSNVKFLTEKEYVLYLMNQRRCNLTSIDDILACAAGELVLACGRRGGKTFLASIISAYESYKLIIKDNPQAYYSMAEDEVIKIVNIASSGDQALELATQIQNRIFNSEWFLPYIASFNDSEINLRTKHDIKKMNDEEKRYGKPLKKRSTIRVESLLCSARGSRGGSVIVALFDELAHFVDNEGNRGGKKIYESLTPSGATFGKDSKIICISSPYTKSGVFYDLYCTSFEDKNTRMLQLPTWEMNPKIDDDFLKNRYKKDTESFWTEYGAQFSTTITGFFKFPEKIQECVSVLGYTDYVDENNEAKKAPIYRQETESAIGRQRYYIALDPAVQANGYSLAMVHCERDEHNRLIVVVDKWRKWSINDPEFSEYDFIDIELIDNYVMDLTKRFRVDKIVYDQFESAASIQKFIKAGIDAIKTHFSRQYNMKIYKNLRSIIYDKRLALLHNEDGIRELVYLQEKSVGKKQFTVEAPKTGDVTTDDLADVLANAVSIALENEMEKSSASISSISVSAASHAQAAGVNLSGRRSYSSIAAMSSMDRLMLARRMGIHR